MPEQWYYSTQGRQVGPSSIEQLREAAADGKLLPTDSVRREGGEWITATEVAGLFSAALAPNPYQSPAPTGTGIMPAGSRDVADAPVPPPAPPLWNPKAAAFWSLLFSWAFGSFLVARNWKALGDAAKARRSMIWFYSFFPFLLCAIVLPEFGEFAAFLRPAGIGLFVAWCIVDRNPQVEYLKQHFGGHYPRKSWLMPIAIATSSMVLCFVAIVGVVVAKSANYGTELTFNGSQVFYKLPVSEDEANRLGQYLVAGKFFDGTPKTVQILKPAANYDFRMVVAEGFQSTPEQVNTVKAFGTEISKTVFNGAPVDVTLCDDQLKPHQTISADR